MDGAAQLLDSRQTDEHARACLYRAFDCSHRDLCGFDHSVEGTEIVVHQTALAAVG